MRLFKRRPVIITSEESEPYGFEPGRVYVIEFNIAAADTQTMLELQTFLLDNGINVKFVPIRDKRVLYPVQVKRMIQKEVQ